MPWAYSVQQALASTLPFFVSKTVNAAADAFGTSGRNTVLAPWYADVDAGVGDCRKLLLE